MYKFVFLFSIVFSTAAHAQNNSSAKDSASSAGSAGKISMAVNLAMGAYTATQCAKPTPDAPMFCIMAAQSFAQVATTGGSAKSANDVASQFDTGFDSFSDLSPINFNGQTYTPEDIQQLSLGADAQIEQLKAKGFEVDPKTGAIKTPKGTAPGSAAASGAGLAAAGLIDEAQIEEYDKMLKKVQSGIGVVSMPGGGGGGGRSSGRSASAYNYESDFALNFGSAGRAPAAAKTKGLSKDFGGTPIGTSTDNIFDMLHRNYQDKVRKNLFVQ